MNWSWAFYRWFLAELLAAIRRMDFGTGEKRYDKGSVVAPAQFGQSSSGLVGGIITPRQAELLPRPGQSIITTDQLGRTYALGDGRRLSNIGPAGAGIGYDPTFTAPPGGPILIPTFPTTLYPDLPRWTHKPPGQAQNHYRADGTGTGIRARAIPLYAFNPTPALMPVAGGITGRRVLGHHPRWADDFWWLNADRVEPGAYGTALINGEPVYQGILRPYWMALTVSGAGSASYPLPVAMAEPEGGGPEEPYFYAFHWYRGLNQFLDVAEEKGSLEYGEGFGLLFHPDKVIKNTIHITPPHITIWEGGDPDFATTEYWWQVGPSHQGPPGLEGTEEQGIDGGIQVNTHEGPLSEFISVEDVTLPTARVGASGVPTPLGEIPATRYTFTPPGVGLEESDKDWLYEGSWTFNRDITVGASDHVVSSMLSLQRATNPTAIPLTTYENEAGTLTMRVSGTEFVKDYVSGDEGNNQPSEAFLIQPDPGDSNTWYWVNCVIHVGDHVVAYDPSAPDLITPHYNDSHNAFEDNHQYGHVVDVQPNTTPQANDWVLTFANVVRRYNSNYIVRPSAFSMPPRYFGSAGSSRTFNVTDTIEIKVRVSTLIRPGTAIYADYGASVETNWMDRLYQPDPQTGWLTVMHTPGYEINFYRRQIVSAPGIQTSDLVQDFKTAYPIHETEDRVGVSLSDPVYQHVELLTPGNAAMSMRQNRGIVRIGTRHPDWDEAYALWNQGLARGLLRIRRPPYSWEWPDYNYWNPSCILPIIPYVDSSNPWPLTSEVINNAGWDRPISDPHVHGGGSGDPPMPLICRPLQRRDHYRLFNGHTVAHVIHPPNIQFLETVNGVQNPYVRAHFEQTAPTIYEGPYGTLKNPFAVLPHESGGTWFDMVIPTRWYTADAIVMSDSSVIGVFLVWHEDRANQEDEFMLHVSGQTPQPVFRYFPDEIVDGVTRTPTRVYSPELGWWPYIERGTVGAMQVIPGLQFIQPDWPFRTGRLGPFAVHEASRHNVPGHNMASAFEGEPRVALVMA